MRRPNGYWTLDTLLESAKSFDTISAWSEADKGAYLAARRLGVIKKVTAHMLTHGESISRAKSKWTKERCLTSASKFEKRFDWEKNDNAAYQAAKKHGWYEECCSHMTRGKQKNGYWTFENCFQEALKYQTITQWLEGNASSYQAAKSNPDWFVACTQHMNKLWEKKWNQETILEEAKKYQTLREWSTSSSGSYSAALKLGIVRLSSDHMLKKPKWIGVSNIQRILKAYDIQFIEEKMFDECRDVRKLPFDFYLPQFNLLLEHHGTQHLRGWQGQGADQIARRDSIKRNFAIKTGYEFLEILEWETHGLEEIEAVILRKLVDINPQFNPCKRELTGEELLDSLKREKFDLESLTEIASRFKTRADFKRGNGPAYNFACRHEFIDLICTHMYSRSQAQSAALTKWTKDKVLASAKKFRTSREWAQEEGAAYNAARKNDWLSEASSHFPASIRKTIKN